MIVAVLRHHFFPSRSFNATLSSIVSASSRFSLAFSSSSAFSRAAIVDRTNGATLTALADVHAAKSGIPFVKGRIADTMLAAQIGNGNAGLMLLQNADDLLFGEMGLLHSGPFGWARAYLKLD